MNNDRLVIEDTQFIAEYEALWRSFDGNSFFRSPSHLQMIVDVCQAHLQFVVARAANGAALAALPFVSKHADHGIVINSLPFYGTYSAIVGGFDYESPLKNRLLQYAQEIHALSLTIVNDWRAQHFSNCQDCTFITTRSNQYLDLMDFREGDALSMYHSKTRNLVRKAMKSAIKVRISTENSDIDSLARLHRDNMQSVKGIAKPQLLFDALKSRTYDLSPRKLYIASIDDQEIAYLLNFYCGDTVEYYMPAIDKAYRSFQPLSLLIHEAIEDAVADGFRYWNFGGTWPTQDSLRHFKSRWGSKEIEYCYFTYVFDQSVHNISIDTLQKSYAYFFVRPFQPMVNTLEIKSGCFLEAGTK